LAMKFTAVAPCLASLPRLELGPNLGALLRPDLRLERWQSG
jgi:hypothetical protein